MASERHRRDRREAIMNHPSKFLQYRTTILSCHCPAFIHRPKDRPCKHIQRLAKSTETIREWRDAQELLYLNYLVP